MYNFDKIIERSNTNSMKWDKNFIKGTCSNENAIPFWVADMDFETSDAIKDTMLKLANHAVPAYVDFPNVNKSFVNFVKKVHNYDLDINLTHPTGGIMKSVALCVNLYTKENDDILVFFPSYQPFVTTVENNKRNVVEYHLDYSNGSFSFNVEKFKAKLEGVKMIILCSPHNPTGYIFSKEELEMILKIAKELDIVIVSDEIHADLTHPGVKHYILDEINQDINAKAITLMAPSKTFNIAGEHYSQIIFANKELEKSYLDAELRLMNTMIGYFAGALAEAAYSSSFDFNKELREYLKGNMDFISSWC